MGLRTTLAVLGLAGLAGCMDAPVPAAGRYVPQSRAEPALLRFVPGTAVPDARSAAELQEVRARLSPGASVLLATEADGAARARSVGLALGRIVQLDPLPYAGEPNDALLTVTEQRLVNTECLGPGLPDARDNWPGDDQFRPRFGSPGCAAAMGLEAMVVDKEDLLHGRALAPGAALPVARAIERYYERTTGPAAVAAETGRTPAAAGSPGTGTGAIPVAVPPGGAADGAGLLQGPLTPGATAAPAAVGQ